MPITLPLIERAIPNSVVILQSHINVFSCSFFVNAPHLRLAWITTQPCATFQCIQISIFQITSHIPTSITLPLVLRISVMSAACTSLETLRDYSCATLPICQYTYVWIKYKFRFRFRFTFSFRFRFRLASWWSCHTYLCAPLQPPHTSTPPQR